MPISYAIYHSTKKISPFHIPSYQLSTNQPYKCTNILIVRDLYKHWLISSSIILKGLSFPQHTSSYDFILCFFFNRQDLGCPCHDHIKSTNGSHKSEQLKGWTQCPEAINRALKFLDGWLHQEHLSKMDLQACGIGFRFSQRLNFFSVGAGRWSSIQQYHMLEEEEHMERFLRGKHNHCCIKLDIVWLNSIELIISFKR